MTSTEINSARTIKRERRSKSRVDQLDQQILDVLAADHPQSVRHVFYRMTDPRLPEPVEKSEAGYRTVQDRMKKLRRERRLPYGWVTDATRRGFHTNTFRNPQEFLQHMKGLYRADLWAQSKFYCEVWCEGRSIAGVIEQDCRELAVSLYPSGGFSSISLIHSAAELINEYHEGKPVVIYYVGDYDPAGVLIDKSIEQELRMHLAEGVTLYFERLAITEEQIRILDLPRKPRKLGDRRAPHVLDTVEAEAMPAHLLRELLRQNVEALLPPAALRIAQVEEESARQYFDTLSSITGQATASD